MNFHKTSNIVLNPSQFNIEHIFFCEPNKNNIMNDGNFIRILYANNTFTLNGIYILLKIHNLSLEQYFNKYKYVFDIKQHSEIIDKISNIERSLLEKSNIKKTPHYKIQSQLKTGNVKIIVDNIDTSNNYLLLRISGIWETETDYGITYKFISIKS